MREKNERKTIIENTTHSFSFTYQFILKLDSTNRPHHKVDNLGIVRMVDVQVLIIPNIMKIIKKRNYKDEQIK